MMPGYNRTFWQHAAQGVLRGVDVPDVALGVDSAEYMASMPVKFAYLPGQAARIVKPQPHDITQMQPDGTGPAVRPEDFPNTGYIGDYIQGW